ncbi:MAG: glycosyltransferase family 1 protein [Patescibacteria group bacterium]
MRIGIDARLYGSSAKGIGRYVKELIENLEKTDLENEYFIFLNQQGFEEYQPQNKNFRKILVNIREYSISEQILWPRILMSYNLDYVHFPHFNVPLFYFRPFVVTIHDLIHWQHNKEASTKSCFLANFKKFIFRMVIRSAVSRAKKIFVVSETIKKELLSEFKISSDKVIVTYEGAYDVKSIFEDSKNINILNRVKKPYLFYVGNAYPHKNLYFLAKSFLSATNQLSEDLYLVLAGRKDYFYEQLEQKIKNLPNNKKIYLLGEVTDQELSLLYQNALAYVFPSLAEGFGLPGLEAMANNLPVLASEIGPLPEVYGEAALYFNPKNENDLAEKIIKIYKDQKLRESLIAKGREQVKKYSWEKCAKETLAVYNSLKK